MNAQFKLEINFVITQFFKLPKTQQRQIYDRLRSPEASQQNTAGVQLLTLLLKNPGEFAAITSQQNRVTAPEELDTMRKALLAYFKTGLKQGADSRTFTIATIP